MQVQYISSFSSTRPVLRGNVYLDQMMGLYNKYFYENAINQLLGKEIEGLNKKIQVILQDKDFHRHLLFCEDLEITLSNILTLKEKTDFFIGGLLFVRRSTSDNRLKKLITNSLEVMEQFVIK